jgi:hypothetical protein
MRPVHGGTERRLHSDVGLRLAHEGRGRRESSRLCHAEHCRADAHGLQDGRSMPSNRRRRILRAYQTSRPAPDPLGASLVRCGDRSPLHRPSMSAAATALNAASRYRVRRPIPGVGHVYVARLTSTYGKQAATRGPTKPSSTAPNRRDGICRHVSAASDWRYELIVPTRTPGNAATSDASRIQRPTVASPANYANPASVWHIPKSYKRHL